MENTTNNRKARRRNSSSNTMVTRTSNRSDKTKEVKGQQLGGERTVQDEALFHGLGRDELIKFAEVKAHYEIQLEATKKPCLFTDTQLLRFAMFCKFSVPKSLQLINKTKSSHFRLNAFALQEQLQTQTLFPLSSELTTKDGSSHVFYMRPSRFLPKERHATSSVIRNLVYVMNQIDTAYPKNQPCHDICFIANMSLWTMKHFSTDYCLKFMQCLQGQVFPVKVSLFLIVNPPSWFGNVWKIMKPMLSQKFQQKVHMISEDKLKDFLSPNYPQYLPNEFESDETGKVDTETWVKDFIQQRQTLEQQAGTDPTDDEESLSNFSGHSSSFAVPERSSKKKHLAAQQEPVEHGVLAEI